MLVLTRKMGEEIIIGKDVRVVVVGLDRGKVRLGVIAPKEVPVDRKEIRAKKKTA